MGEVEDALDRIITDTYGTTAYWRVRDGVTHLVISGTRDAVCDTEADGDEEIGFNNKPPEEGTEVCGVCYGVWELCLADLGIKRKDKLTAVKL